MSVPDHDLTETLREAQRFGFFGPGSIEDAVDHASAFEAPLRGQTSTDPLADLGSGGGLPGLELAAAFPDTPMTFIDRRTKRTDFLRRAVRRHGFDHVDVVADDVDHVISEVMAGERPGFTAVTARGFGPPEATLRAAAALMTPDGRIVISEPPSGDRWAPRLLDELSLVRVQHDRVVVFRH